MSNDLGATTLLGGIIRDPVRMRWWSRRAAAVVTVGGGAAYGFMGGAARELVIALTWIALMPLAAGLGIGAAFFLRHGVGKRRVLGGLVVGAAVALGACVLLAEVPKKSQIWSRNMLDAVGYALLYGSLLTVLAGLVAVAIAFGTSYVAERIDERIRDDW